MVQSLSTVILEPKKIRSVAASTFYPSEICREVMGLDDMTLAFLMFKRCLLFGRKAMTNLDSVLKSRDITLLSKVHIVKAWFFQKSCTMWEADHKEGWVLKNWCFQTVVLEKTLESSSECKDDLLPVHSSVQFSSVAQSCPTLYDPMNRSTPGLPVNHQLPEFTQTHVHWVSDAIQPSHPLEMFPVLTVASWPAYRFLKRQVRWSGIPISWRIFHSLLWSTQSKALA